MSELLELIDVEVRYGDFRAVRGVSLTLAAGETLAVLGANGAGKSTLLEAIAGLLPVAAGEIRFAGHGMARVPAHQRVARGISLVPEGRRLFATLTVAENLQVGAYRAGPGPWDLAAVYDLFPLLAQRRGRRADALSGGEQQAVAIGRALMANPKLLLLDEVSLGLAPIVVRQLYAALPKITAAGTTVLLVEQNMHQAMAVADRVHCLLEGRTALAGRTSEVSTTQISQAYFGIPAEVSG